MICGVCKLQVPLHVRKEHLIKCHKLGAHLVNWIIQTDNDLIALEPKIRTHQGKLEIPKVSKRVKAQTRIVNMTSDPN